jgi:hypothetical protein
MPRGIGLSGSGQAMPQPAASSEVRSDRHVDRAALRKNLKLTHEERFLQLMELQRLDAETLERGLNFRLTTELGDSDLLGEITGGGGYASLAPHALEIELFGFRWRVDLAKLIEVKRAAGRPKDLEVIAELEALREERG